MRPALRETGQPLLFGALSVLQTVDLSGATGAGGAQSRRPRVHGQTFHSLAAMPVPVLCSMS
jgi:hypothetical protein